MMNIDEKGREYKKEELKELDKLSDEEKKIHQQREDIHMLSEIRENFELCKMYYMGAQRRMRLLDATDRGDLWKALNAKYPKYQILPDTNYISYVKSNILASIYTVAKGASIRPTSEKDKDLLINLNIAIEYVWDMCGVGFFQFQAGERAALLNLGITQVGWDEKLTGGNGDAFYKGNTTLKNIDPMKFMRDPFAVDFEHAGFCMTYEKYHKSVLMRNPLYADKAKAYFARMTQSPMEVPDHSFAQPTGSAKDYGTLVTYWRKHHKKVEEYHVLNCEVVLYSNKDVQPAEFPFALLYCNIPAGDLVGTSECHKVFANNVAHNLLDSIALTSEYKNQRPPKFISQSSGLNVQSFAKYGDDADKTFLVNGKPMDAVYYHKFPQVSPAVSSLKMDLAHSIQLTSGVDGRYTGRDTGSILTTGGVEDMLNRVTLIDTPKIMLYENYTKHLSRLIMSNLIHFAPNRKYFVQKKNSTEWETVDVSFEDIDNDTLFNYAIDVSSELPKNKQRIAATADMLMQHQMQYSNQGNSVQLITEEEWLSMIDLPNKELMLERMGVQRRQTTLEEVSQVLFTYADLVKQGADPNDAIMATAQGLNDARQGNMPEPQIPGVMPASAMPQPGVM